MVDCAHEPPSGPFVGKDKAERSEIVIKLISLIKKHTLVGLVATAVGDSFSEEAAGADVYTISASTCIDAMVALLKSNGIEKNIHFFFESGHQSADKAHEFVAQRLQEYGASLSFLPKGEACLLQAADLLAWQAAKYTKDSITKARKPRKDFLSLMEHRHCFANARVNAGSIRLEIVDWPETARPASRQEYTVLSDEPVFTLRDQIPGDIIIPIDKFLGFRATANNNNAYIKFSQPNGCKLSLLVNELGVLQGLDVFASATKIVESKWRFRISSINISNIDNGINLEIGLFPVGRLSFALDSALIDELAKLLEGYKRR